MSGSRAPARAILNRSGDGYKLSVVCSYDERSNCVCARGLGARKASALTRGDLLSIVERRQAAGLSASTIRNAIIPLRAIYRLKERAIVNVLHLAIDARYWSHPK